MSSLLDVKKVIYCKSLFCLGRKKKANHKGKTRLDSELFIKPETVQQNFESTEEILLPRKIYIHTNFHSRIKAKGISSQIWGNSKIAFISPLGKITYWNLANQETVKTYNSEMKKPFRRTGGVYSNHIN